MLRVVCYLLAASGLLFMATPFIDMALHRYEGPVAFFAGVFLLAFAVPLFFLSRFKAVTQPRVRPIISGILWTVAVTFRVAAIRLLYFGIQSYL